MSKNTRDDLEKLENLTERIAESFIEMSNDELLRVLADEGEDVSSIASRTRALFTATDKNFRQRSLRAAKQKHEENLGKLKNIPLALPGNAKDWRNWLDAALQRQPELKNALTLQHREFSSVTDDEVASYLRQLIALGVIDQKDLK